MKRILKDVKDRMECRPDDYLRLNLRYPSLQSDIWFEFTQSQNLDENIVLNKVQAVLQSKKEFTLTDGAAELELFHVHYPQGRGGNQMKHLQRNKETFKSDKQFIVRIMNQDTICLARVIVVDRSDAQKPASEDSKDYATWKRRWERIRRRDILSKKQRNEAVELMKSADCDLYRICGGGPEEWVKLQKDTPVSIEGVRVQERTPRLELNSVLSRALGSAFGGTYPRDLIPHRLRPYEKAILVNTDPHDKPGTHWMCMYMVPPVVEYFDSTE